MSTMEEHESERPTGRKKVDTEENWKKIQTILIQNPMTPIIDISIKIGISKQMGKKLES